MASDWHCGVVLTLSLLGAGSLAADPLLESDGGLTQPTVSNVVATKSPRFSQLETRMHALLRKHSTADDVGQQIECTLSLVQFAEGVRADRRFATSPTLQKMWGRTAARLRRVKRETHQQMRRARKRPATIAIDQAVLAQLAQAAAPQNQAPNNAPIVGGDYGPQLIDLIQRTISPRSWAVNGGASTIQYWRPGMALVVRAPQDVHAEIGPLVGQLRK